YRFLCIVTLRLRVASTKQASCRSKARSGMRFAVPGLQMEEPMTDERDCTIWIDGDAYTGGHGSPLPALLDRHSINLPRVCYHAALGALQTCDTCWVEVDGRLQRACSLTLHDGLTLSIAASEAVAARAEGMDRILA